MKTFSKLSHRVLLPAATASLLFTALMPGAVLAHQKNGPNDIHVCHRTSSETNPYNLLHLPPSAVDGKNNGNDDHRGHADQPNKDGRIDYIEGYNAPADVFENFTKDSDCDDYAGSQHPGKNIPVVPAAAAYPALAGVAFLTSYGVRRWRRGRQVTK